MISLELIREHPDQVREGMRRRGEDAPIDRIVELDAERRRLIVEGDGLRTRRNQVSREIGRTRERPPELIEEMRGVAARIRELEGEVRDRETEINSLLLSVPNIPRDDVPVAENEAGNVIVRTVGDVPAFEFEPLAHWELGEALGIIEFQRAVKVSGSRFFGFRGKGSKLQRALVSWMLDLHTEEHGYEEVYVPFMVTRESAIGSGHLPKFADTMYHDQEDDMWMVPTAEVPITNLHRREILPAGTVPLYYVAHTPCFRRERAAAGKDTRGIKRVHQFEKVEMYKFVEPDSSDDELERLVADAEDVCVRLGIPHRVVQLCTGGPRRRVRQDVRHRDVGPRQPGVAGGELLLRLHRLPGPPGVHPVQAGAGGPGPVRAHAQRIGTRGASRTDRHPGELPAAGRLGSRSRGAAPLHRLRRHRLVS